MITAAGRAALAAMFVRERPLFAAAAVDAGAATELRAAVAVLRRLRERMDILILAARDRAAPKAIDRRVGAGSKKTRGGAASKQRRTKRR
ncbi:MAG: hypothetical protein NTZ61_13105 [Proteobacteria bacterium]|nr:hypothetical protein [Pseudomonadota bacterium]